MKKLLLYTATSALATSIFVSCLHDDDDPAPSSATNRAPVITQGASMNVPVFGTLTTLTLSATDADNNALSWSVTTQPSTGVVTVNPTSGNMTTVTLRTSATLVTMVSAVVRVSDTSLHDTITLNFAPSSTVNVGNNLIAAEVVHVPILASNTTAAITVSATNSMANLNWSIMTQPSTGMVTLSATTGNMTTVNYMFAAPLTTAQMAIIRATSGSLSTDTVRINFQPVRPLTQVIAYGATSQVTVRWTTPSFTGYQGATVAYVQGSTPAATCPEMSGGGVSVMSTNDANDVDLVITGLTGTQTYSFRACADYTNGLQAPGVVLTQQAGLVDGTVFDNATDAKWSVKVGAFDRAIGFNSCVDDNGAACPSVSWQITTTTETTRGYVIRAEYSTSAMFNGLFVGQTPNPNGTNGFGHDFTHYINNSSTLQFDLRIVTRTLTTAFTVKLDCSQRTGTQNSAGDCPTDMGQREQSVPNSGVGQSGWISVSIPIGNFVNANGGSSAGGLLLDRVTTGLVIWTGAFSTPDPRAIFEVDNVRWVP